MSEKIETILRILGDMQEFSPNEYQSDELSEADLMYVSAARSIPNYKDFLKRIQDTSAK